MDGIFDLLKAALDWYRLRLSGRRVFGEAEDASPQADAAQVREER